MCSNPDQTTRSKDLLCNTTLTYRKVHSNSCLVFFFRLSSTESVTLIPSNQQIVDSWVRPGGIGELFFTLSRNYALVLISNYTFNFPTVMLI